MAFVAIKEDSGELLGVSRVVLEPDRKKGEFGILVRSDLHGHGLGWQLMRALLDYARSEGVEEVAGLVHAENRTMLKMAHELGFKSVRSSHDAAVHLVVWRPNETREDELRKAG
jgi:acetyltransferase